MAKNRRDLPSHQRVIFSFNPDMLIDRWVEIGGDLPLLAPQQLMVLPFQPDKIIDRWVEIAGDLPSHQFEIEKLKKGEVVTYTGSAREKLHSALEHALLLYRSAGEGHRSSKRRVTELRRTEAAAHRLLMLVGGAHDDIPSLSLHHTVAKEVERLRQALGQDPKRLGQAPVTFFSALARLQTAIEGVEAIRRWAKLALEQNSRRIAKLRPEKLGSGHARHKGDIALNKYIEAVVKECWSGVWGRTVSDGPKLRRFVVEAAAGIDERLSEDASRERIRRIFDLRRANRKVLDRDLPKLQARRS